MQTTRNKRKLHKLAVSLIAVFCLPMFSNDVLASGGERMETVSFNEFLPMDCALFLETDVNYAISIDYYRYGIYGDFIENAEDGVNIYYELSEAVTGNKMPSPDFFLDDSMMNEHISNVSPDLTLMATKLYDNPAGDLGTERLYKNGNKLDEQKLIESHNLVGYSFQRVTGSEAYEAIPEQKIKEAEKIIEAVWNRPGGNKWNNVYCSFDEFGELFAISEEDSSGIRIYQTNDWNVLYSIPINHVDTDYPIEISQIKGDAENGWLVYSCGANTYRMTYPDGTSEKIGEFMYCTTYSPDGKYRAYCTGNSALYEMWEILPEEKQNKYNSLRARWDAIPPGWYVEELETGNTVYIPTEPDIQDWRKVIYGGRCVWLNKDNLLDMLNMQTRIKGVE